MKPLREYMRDRRVAAALAVVALLSVGYRLLKPGGGPAPPPGQAVEASPSAPDAAEPVFPPPARAYAPPPARLPAEGRMPEWKWDRNPFLPPAGDPAGKSGAAASGGSGAGDGAGADALPRLRGTVVGGKAGMAIFGNRLVPVGGTIGEWTLTKVEPYGVFLRKGKETRVLELYRQ